MVHHAAMMLLLSIAVVYWAVCLVAIRVAARLAINSERRRILEAVRRERDSDIRADRNRVRRLGNLGVVGVAG